MMKNCPLSESDSIGMMLIRSGVIDSGTLARAMRILAERVDTHIGEILVEMGVIKQPTLEAFLAKQTALRTNKPKDVAVLVQFATRHTQAQTKAVIAVHQEMVWPPK
jgi:hypothetical protein